MQNKTDKRTPTYVPGKTCARCGQHKAWAKFQRVNGRGVQLTEWCSTCRHKSRADQRRRAAASEPNGYVHRANGTDKRLRVRVDANRLAEPRQWAPRVDDDQRARLALATDLRKAREGRHM